ncbi:MAG: GDP-mannose 4,6-dehydratase [Anaerolineales bacterium]|nr:GDP-mannose 4,6-dehydratase [Anaerolineales bacterium]
MARYLVTGAAGFIGARVSTLLVEQGHQVVGIDSLNSAYDVRLKHWRLQKLQALPGFAFSRGDIADRVAIETLWKKHDGDAFDAVINLAARAGAWQSVENPYVYMETNAAGTLHLLELARQGGVKKFVLASTSSLYGESKERHFREDLPTDGPLSPYAATKKAAEVICYTYHFLYNLDVTVLRYFTVFGPAGRPEMSLFRFVLRIAEGKPITVYGDGTQERDFTYIDDIARGTIAALKPLGYEIINLGSDRPVVLRDAIALIERLTGKQAVIEYKPRPAADMLSSWADIAKARKLLGWEPQAAFEEGVARIVEWYRAEQSWASQLNLE